jgi:hypothetical protein
MIKVAPNPQARQTERASGKKIVMQGAYTSEESLGWLIEATLK